MTLPLQSGTLICINPVKRCQCTILHQGMMDSLKICQLHVSQSLVNVPNDVLLIHYMDDLLPAHPDAVYLQISDKKY